MKEEINRKSDMISILTKEEFWDKITEKAPKQAGKFYDWINEYKQRNQWQKLFNGGHMLLQSSPEYKNWNTHTSAPKFHELPVGMQIGIFIQYLQETPHKIPFLADLQNMDTIGKNMGNWFENNEGL